MPDLQTNTQKNTRDALEKAFKIFQAQSEVLEQSHAELKAQLNAAQLDLQQKNRELAQRIREIEAIKERLSGTLESITDAVFLVDPGEERVETANSTAEQLLTSIGKNCSSLLEVEPLAKLIRAGLKVNDQSISFKINGEHVYWIISVIPMLGGEQSCEVVSIKDVTEQKNLEIRLAREDRMAALGKVAASVAHEIRNPLAAIEGFATLLQRDLKDNPDSRKLADKTIYAARQLNAVVGNLLSYTREFIPSRIACSINGILLETMGFVTPMAEDQVVTLETELAQDMPPVEVDPVLMKQVFLNIITNAVEACPRRAGGMVRISTESDGATARVVISDNGAGIATDRKTRIFEPFFTMKDGGIGLGLALCQRIVDAHHGRIEERGVPGQGAEFVIELNSSREVVT